MVLRPHGGLLKNGKAVTTRKWGRRGEEVATLARENLREKPSLGGYMCTRQEKEMHMQRYRAREEHGQTTPPASSTY